LDSTFTNEIIQADNQIHGLQHEPNIFSKHPDLKTQEIFTQHSGLYPRGITPHALHSLLQERSGLDEPLPGLNLDEYFSKHHLVDLTPIEPLPPIENPLEMT